MTLLIEKLVFSNASSRPLVTFALFAYNQEKYIRAAVEGALSQTYEPLEIIISDDCSTDNTFSIAQEMVREYNGNHNLILNKNQKNLGLVKHVNMIFSMARGEIIVTAAGDDVSCPQRTNEIVSEFEKFPNALAVHSNAVVIDASDADMGVMIPPIVEFNTDLISMATSNSIHIGATGAYKKKIYQLFGEINELDVYEDLILGFRAAVADGLIHINRPLVKYRQGVGISTKIKELSLYGKFKNRKSTIRRNISVLKQRLRDCEPFASKLNGEIQSKIRNELDFNILRLSLYESPLRFLIAFLVPSDRVNLRRAIRCEADGVLRLTQKLLKYGPSR